MPLRQNNPELVQDPTDLIAGLHHWLDLERTYAHQCLYGLRCLALDADRSNLCSRRCFSSRVCITRVVLMRPVPVSLDRFRRHHLDPKTQALEKTSPIVGAATGLEADQTARRLLFHEPHEGLTLQPF